MLILIISGLIGAFSFSPMHFALSAWIWPALLLYLMRSQPVKKAIVCGYLSMAISLGVGYSNVIYSSCDNVLSVPVSIALTTVAIIAISLPLTVPFILDRLVFGRMNRIQTMMFFPFAYASFELLFSLLPFGTLTSISYSQIGFLPLLQGMTVFGTFGITFLIGWFATTAWMIYTDYVREKNWKKIDLTAVCCIAVIAIILISGSIRLSEQDSGEDMQVMCVYGPYNIIHDQNSVTALPDNLACFDRSMELASEKDVDMMIATEEAYNINQSDLQTFIDHVSDASRTYGIPVLFGVKTTVDPDHNYNQIIFVSPENGFEWKYTKVHLLPIDESDHIAGTEPPGSSDIAFGKISGLICFDLDFPVFVNRLPSDLDILAAVSWDWKELSQWRTESTSYRSIENGFSFLKFTFNGTIGSYDMYGRTVEMFDLYPTSTEDFSIVSVPAGGCITFYGQNGLIVDLFYLLVAIAIVLSCFITRNGKERFLNRTGYSG